MSKNIKTISVSIIVPVYKVEKYIQRCVQSILCQRNVDAFIECIFVDDCSPDSSMDIVRKELRLYDGPIVFLFIKHEENLGLSMARNNGLQNASGDYIFFMDSDDYLLPNSMEYILGELKSHSGVDMIISNVKNCKDNSSVICNIQEPTVIIDNTIIFRKLLNKELYAYAWNKLIKRDFLLENKLYFEKGILYEDILWSYFVFRNLTSVLVLPEVTYVYEYNPSSIVNAIYTREKVEKVLGSYIMICNKLLDSPPASDNSNIDFTVDYLLYIENVLMMAIDMFLKYGSSSESKIALYGVRRRLITRAITSCRLFLFLFFLLLYSPLNNLLNFSFFRKNYYKLTKIINRLAHLTDPFHIVFN